MVRGQNYSCAKAGKNQECLNCIKRGTSCIVSRGGAKNAAAAARNTSTNFERNASKRVQLFMKYLLLLALLGFFINCHGQAKVADRSPVPATRVLSPGSAENRLSPAEHASNWKLETMENPSNASAWLNYYIWTERDQRVGTGKKRQSLAKLVTDAGSAIPGTAEYALLRYLESGKKDSSALFQALTLASDRQLVYPYVIQYLVRQNNKELAGYCQMLEQLSPLPKSLYEYHYNVLMSADSNATVYAQGLNDLVPMTVLQQVHGIRKDIRLQHYETKQVVSPDAYLCLSLGKEILAQYPKATYTGLLVKAGGATGIDELKKHLTASFTWNFIKTGMITGEAAVLYNNYLPSFILLYRHYKQEGDARAEEIKMIIQRIANSVQAGSAVDALLEK
jgi:hypothetical protein